ncbi:MAG: efflux RND transporter periplasmic adaptor subunit [Bacteroidales bacterium]|jgi:membrane fusion protein (multidrug efflux system)|nr:efflux RND transporter periplasmic adaptor subunit [Bacteroidales bacterium]
MKKKKIRSLVTYLTLLLLLIIILYPKFGKQLFSTDEDFTVRNERRQQILNVSGFIVKPSHITEQINSNGTLMPDEEVDLSFETSGKITGIYFSEGTSVSEGDLLAKINDRHLQAQLLKLEAQKKLLEEKEYRQRALLEKDAISQESYDQIVTELQTTEADILLVKARILETELRAPFDGKIGLRYLSEGSFASPNSKIARLVKIKPLKIEFSVPERYAGELKPGYPISFRVDGYNELFSAKVYAIDPKIDINTRTIVVRALYPNRNEEHKPGRFAGISLTLREVDDAISIPTEALIPEMDGEKVYVYRGGKAHKVAIETGLRTESVIQIIEGLNFNDTLIVSGILQLREGLPVMLDSLINN